MFEFLTIYFSGAYKIIVYTITHMVLYYKECKMHLVKKKRKEKQKEKKADNSTCRCKKIEINHNEIVRFFKKKESK